MSPTSQKKNDYEGRRKKERKKERIKKRKGTEKRVMTGISTICYILYNVNLFKAWKRKEGKQGRKTKTGLGKKKIYIYIYHMIQRKEEKKVDRKAVERKKRKDQEIVRKHQDERYERKTMDQKKERKT